MTDWPTVRLTGVELLQSTPGVIGVGPSPLLLQALNSPEPAILESRRSWRRFCTRNLLQVGTLEVT